jgi:ketosteroid isomerase-like protein
MGIQYEYEISRCHNFGGFRAACFAGEQEMSTGSENIATAKKFLGVVLSEPAVAQTLLHDDFDFVFMGRSQISDVQYNKETYFSVWLGEVLPPLLPDGFRKLEVVDAIGDSAGVALIVEGDADGINGLYDNKYVYVYKFKDGKIRSLREYSSDLMVATRLFRQKLVADE